MVYAIVAVIVLIIDQAVKMWIVRSDIIYGMSREFIPGFMDLTHHHNTGMAFGLFADTSWGRWFFIALTLVFCAVIIYLLSRNIIRGRAGRWLIVLVMAGGLGNCIDRVINGYVVDMFDFSFKIFGQDFPIFNVADMFVTVCGIAFCLWLIFHKEPFEEKTAGGPPKPRNKAELERARSKAIQQRIREQTLAEPHQDDYITQLKKPVATAKNDLERERERQRLAAEEQAQAKAARAAAKTAPPVVRTRPTAQREPDLSNPFADFIEQHSEPMPTRRDGVARRESQPLDYDTPIRSSGPAPVSPPMPSRATVPPPPEKKDDMQFSLDDILAEFSDK
jgi:signal peptidase II